MPPESWLPAAVLFDMDGTLVDSEPLWEQAEVNLMRRYGSSWTREDQQVAIGGPVMRVGRYMADKAMADGHPGLTAEQVVSEVLDEFARLLAADPVPVHGGARGLLEEALDLGLPTALVSNSPRRFVESVLTTHPDLRFTVSIAGDEVEHPKPDPFPYLTAARTLNVDITRCLVVEDSPTGVASAVASGAHVLAVELMGRLDPGPRGVAVASLTGLTLGEVCRRIHEEPVD